LNSAVGEIPAFRMNQGSEVKLRCPD